MSPATNLNVRRTLLFHILLKLAADVVDFVELLPCKQFDFHFDRLIAAVDKRLAHFSRRAADMALACCLAVDRFAQTQTAFDRVGTKIENRSDNA